MIRSFSFLLQRISRFPYASKSLPKYLLSENVKEKQLRENDMLWIAANAEY